MKEKLKEIMNNIKAEIIITDGESRRYMTAWEDGYNEGSSEAYWNVLTALEELVKDDIDWDLDFEEFADEYED